MATAAVALFLVHPLGAEPLRWAAAFSEELLLAALLVKEAGVVVPVLLAAEALRAPRAEWRARLAAVIPSWVVVPPYLLARAAMLPDSGVHVALDGLAARVLGLGRVLAWDAARLVWPLPLSPIHPMPEGAAWTAAGVAALAATAAALAVLAWRRPRALFWAAWIALPLAPPAAQLLLSRETGVPVAERYLFLSLLPALVALAWAASALAGRLRPGAASRARAAALALAIGGAAAATAAYAPSFDGDDAYFARVLAVHPDEPVALAALGTRALRADDPARALALLERSAAIEPGRAVVQLNLGLARRALGDRPAALRHLAAAVTLDDRLAVAHAALAAALREEGRLAEAGPHYEAAARLAPGSAAAHLDLGTWRWTTGDRPGGLAAWEAGLAADPRSCELRFDVALGRTALGRPGAHDAARAFVAGCGGPEYAAQRAQAQAWVSR